MLLARPAQPQDRGHARLYFVRPALRASLALLWLGSGLVGLLQPSAVTAALLSPLGLGPRIGQLACVLDVAIGIAVLARWRPGWVALIQLLVIIGYTLALTVADAALWLDPFGPLLKNVPILLSVLVLAVLERER